LKWTPKDEKKLVSRIDRKLLPLLIITDGMQYHDKAMLSQAVGRYAHTAFLNIS
jgi:hypothetical protein